MPYELFGFAHFIGWHFVVGLAVVTFGAGASWLTSRLFLPQKAPHRLK